MAQEVMSIFQATQAAVREIDGKWYAFGLCEYKDSRPDQVFSIGADAPEHGKDVANFSDGGITEVSTASPSKKAAVAKAKRFVAKFDGYGYYAGIV